MNQISALYGGRIPGHLGTFRQLAYDGVENIVALDLTDVCHANQESVLDQE